MNYWTEHTLCAIWYTKVPFLLSEAPGVDWHHPAVAFDKVIVLSEQLQAPKDKSDKRISHNIGCWGLGQLYRSFSTFTHSFAENLLPSQRPTMLRLQVPPQSNAGTIKRQHWICHRSQLAFLSGRHASLMNQTWPVTPASSNWHETRTFWVCTYQLCNVCSLPGLQRWSNPASFLPLGHCVIFCSLTMKGSKLVVCFSFLLTWNLIFDQ